VLENAPEKFRAAYDRGDENVRLAIEAFARRSESCFLVFRAEFDSTSVRSVGVLFARELLMLEVAPEMMARAQRMGTLSDAMRHQCPRCRTPGYLYCNEYSDRKFDPDWHSDLYVLCTACPNAERVVHDLNGFYSPASSS
jgi:hypothetical protein